MDQSELAYRSLPSATLFSAVCRALFIHMPIAIPAIRSHRRPLLNMIQNRPMAIFLSQKERWFDVNSPGLVRSPFFNHCANW